MTGLFLWPLLRTRFRNHQLRRISRRTVTAATIVLGTSTANICGLVIRHGVERGFACLAAWECDVSSPYSTNSPSFSKYQQKKQRSSSALSPSSGSPQATVYAPTHQPSTPPPCAPPTPAPARRVYGKRSLCLSSRKSFVPKRARMKILCRRP